MNAYRSTTFDPELNLAISRSLTRFPAPDTIDHVLQQ
jgi:hypothetical protein